MCISDSKIGVLNDEQLVSLIEDGYIKNFNLTKSDDCSYEDIDGSSLDLHITDNIKELYCTEKIDKSIPVQKIFEKASEHKISKKLEKNHIYLIKLKEELDFEKFNGKSGLYGRTSGRSTIGRLDILTRLVVDYCPKYDEIPPYYSGNLYLEVIPLSFNIKLKENQSLNQLRIFHGKPDLSLIPDNKLNDYAPMLYIQKGSPILHDFNSLSVCLDKCYIDKEKKIEAIAFKSIKTNDDLLLDLNENKINPRSYWEFEPAKNHGDNFSQGMIMEKERFYILRSSQRMLLPSDVAVTCIAYTENLGELRIHYAGFAHPNFGHHKEKDKIGAPLIFEARCHHFDVKIKDKEQFARIEYYKMSKPTNMASGYSDQELKLSKFFKNWND